MVHMDRMIIVYVWECVRSKIQSARAKKISNKVPQEPMDAMGEMGLKWLSELLSILVRGQEVDV